MYDKNTELQSRIVITISNSELIKKIGKKAAALRVSRSDAVKIAIYKFLGDTNED